MLMTVFITTVIEGMTRFNPRITTLRSSVSGATSRSSGVQRAMATKRIPTQTPPFITMATST